MSPELLLAIICLAQHYTIHSLIRRRRSTPAAAPSAGPVNVLQRFKREPEELSAAKVAMDTAEGGRVHSQKPFGI